MNIFLTLFKTNVVSVCSTYVGVDLHVEQGSDI